MYLTVVGHTQLTSDSGKCPVFHANEMHTCYHTRSWNTLYL